MIKFFGYMCVAVLTIIVLVTPLAAADSGADAGSLSGVTNQSENMHRPEDFAADSQKVRSAHGYLSISEAALLGVVEGVTEYLPVSSTGHLLLAEQLMGIGHNCGSVEQCRQVKEAANAYTIVIQLGAIVAVLGLYFARVRQMWRGLRGHDAEGRQLLINISAGFIPAAIIGLLFNKAIKAYLFGSWPVVLAWFVGGLVILALERRPRAAGTITLLQLGWRTALLIGCAQCIAMWPGVSRSLVTIVAGVLGGLTLATAVEFSFLLGLVTLSAATAYDMLKHGALMLHTFDISALLIGLVCAFVAALVSVKWMVAYLNRRGLALFGYYRVALALVSAALLLSGVLT